MTDWNTLLHEKGLRRTPLRKAIVRALEQYGKPLDIPGLQAKLKDNGIKPDRTSLYRQMQTLEGCGIVTPVDIDGPMTYELTHGHHHHHFVCRVCAGVQCVPTPQMEPSLHALEEDLKRKGIRVESHRFSLQGVCGECAEG